MQTLSWSSEQWWCLLQMQAFQRDVMNYVKPNHGTTTLGFVFQGGVIIAVDSRASQGSYICKPIFLLLWFLRRLPCKFLASKPR